MQFAKRYQLVMSVCVPKIVLAIQRKDVYVREIKLMRVRVNHAEKTLYAGQSIMMNQNAIVRTIIQLVIHMCNVSTSFCEENKW
jgi:hypothetical protein